MAYNKDELFELGRSEATKNRLIFIEDIIAMLPCSKPTFYEYFPKDSDELNDLKEILNKNKVELKVSMRQKWYKSDHPTLQVALMKIIGSDEEAHRLNGSKTQSDVTIHEEQPLFPDTTKSEDE